MVDCLVDLKQKLVKKKTFRETLQLNKTGPFGTETKDKYDKNYFRSKNRDKICHEMLLLQEFCNY